MHAVFHLEHEIRIHFACVDLTVVCLLQVSAFYVSKERPQHLVRFCFCKSDEKLRKAADQMQKYFRTLWEGLWLFILWTFCWRCPTRQCRSIKPAERFHNEGWLLGNDQLGTDFLTVRNRYSLLYKYRITCSNLSWTDSAIGTMLSSFHSQLQICLKYDTLQRGMPSSTAFPNSRNSSLVYSILRGVQMLSLIIHSYAFSLA